MTVMRATTRKMTRLRRQCFFDSDSMDVGLLLSSAGRVFKLAEHRFAVSHACTRNQFAALLSAAVAGEGRLVITLVRVFFIKLYPL